MKFLVLALTLMTSLLASAQTSKASSSKNHVIAATMQAVVNAKGEMKFEGKDIVTGKLVMLSAEDGFEALKILAKAACLAGPSSVTVSAGVVSVTWEKAELCK
jgi:hypothetical protein